MALTAGYSVDLAARPPPYELPQGAAPATPEPFRQSGSSLDKTLVDRESARPEMQLSASQTSGEDPRQLLERRPHTHTPLHCQCGWARRLTPEPLDAARSVPPAR